jgi:hypothetical protein
VNELQTCPHCGTRLYGLVRKCYACGAAVEFAEQRRVAREQAASAYASRRSNRRIVAAIPWIAAIVIGASLGAYRFVTTQPVDIGAAVRQDYATVRITALAPRPLERGHDFGDRPPRAALVVLRSRLSPEELTIVVPAGTLIRDADPGSQRLMTARSLIIHLSKGSPSAAATIDLLCLDQFAEAPKPGAHLALAAPDPNAPILVETEPIRKLNDCLQSQEYHDGSDQLAIWLVTENHLNETYHHALSTLTERYRRKMLARLQSLPTVVPESVRRDAPEVDPAFLQVVYQHFRTTQFATTVDDYARAEAELDMRAFTGPAAQALNACGYNTRDSELMRTAPKRK